MLGYYIDAIIDLRNSRFFSIHMCLAPQDNSFGKIAEACANIIPSRATNIQATGVELWPLNRGVQADNVTDLFSFSSENKDSGEIQYKIQVTKLQTMSCSLKKKEHITEHNIL